VSEFVTKLFYHTAGGVSVGEIFLALLLCFGFATLAASFDDRQPRFPKPPREPQPDDERFWAGPRR
jgi:hypothetical protein